MGHYQPSIQHSAHRICVLSNARHAAHNHCSLKVDKYTFDCFCSANFILGS